MKGPASQDTPELIAELRALALGGTPDEQISSLLGISVATVVRYRRRHDIPAGRHKSRPLEFDDAPVAVVAEASRAELVAAARPRVQRPWSARDGLR